jgi:hypothetical protein
MMDLRSHRKQICYLPLYAKHAVIARTHKHPSVSEMALLLLFQLRPINLSYIDNRDDPEIDGQIKALFPSVFLCECVNCFCH